MGVSTNWYTLIGVKHNFDDKFTEAWDNVYSDEDTPYVLIDCMSGEYMIFGEVLFDSGDYRYGFEDGDSYKEYSLEEISEKEKNYKESFVRKFPEFAHLVNVQFKVISVAHYS